VQKISLPEKAGRRPDTLHREELKVTAASVYMPLQPSVGDWGKKKWKLRGEKLGEWVEVVRE